MSNFLVQPLFDGPLDIVGDVHGEIDALKSLMHRLGYDDAGVHSDGRRLVFVGDLTDRGPDSPSVIKLVQSLVEAGRAQCVLGNHDLNILLGDTKHDNHWFFGDEWSLDGSDEPTPAVLADNNIRQTVLYFLRNLPLVLERDDIRVVHACWDDSMVEIARESSDAVSQEVVNLTCLQEARKAQERIDKICGNEAPFKSEEKVEVGVVDERKRKSVIDVGKELGLDMSEFGSRFSGAN